MPSSPWEVLRYTAIAMLTCFVPSPQPFMGEMVPDLVDLFLESEEPSVFLGMFVWGLNGITTWVVRVCNI